MAREKQKFRMYEGLAAAAPQILDDARKAAADLGLAQPGSDFEVHLNGGARRNVLKPYEPLSRPAPDAAADNTHRILSEIRGLVKDAFGDSYDACPVKSASLGLALCGRIVNPPAPKESQHERIAVVVPRMKPSEMFAGYLAMPPKYRSLSEFASDVDGKDAGRVTAAVVPLVGASYCYHGITPGQVPMIAGANPETSLQVVAATANTYSPWLAGVIAIGPGMPGCGFGPADDAGLPLFHSALGELASEFDVPFLVDNSSAIPFLGPNRAKALVSAEVFGPYGAGKSGLVIGTEEAVIPMLSAANPALPAPDLPPPSQLRKLYELLNEVRENPERYTRLVSRMYDIVTSEFARLRDDFKTLLRFRKNYEALAVEVNYEDTWSDSIGFPVFSAEDLRRGTHLLHESLRNMGIACIEVAGAGFVIGPPREALEASPAISMDYDRLRLEVQGLTALIEIVGKHAGYPV